MIPKGGKLFAKYISSSGSPSRITDILLILWIEYWDIQDFRFEINKSNDLIIPLSGKTCLIHCTKYLTYCRVAVKCLIS